MPERQAEILATPEGDVLIDWAGSTLVNGVKVAGRQRLRSLDVIRIGTQELRYYPPIRSADGSIGGPAVPPPDSSQRSQARPLAIFRIKGGPDRGRWLEVWGVTTTIGRAIGNDIVLANPSVGLRHARLELREKVWNLIEIE